MCSEPDIPIYYYLIRDRDGDVRGVLRSRSYHTEQSWGAYEFELTNKEIVETLEELGVVDSFVNPIVS